MVIGHVLWPEHSSSARSQSPGVFPRNQTNFLKLRLCERLDMKVGAQVVRGIPILHVLFSIEYYLGSIQTFDRLSCALVVKKSSRNANGSPRDLSGFARTGQQGGSGAPLEQMIDSELESSLAMAYLPKI